MCYRAAAGIGEEANSRQRHWCLWSKPVNVGSWELVPDPIIIAHAFAELGYGTLVHTRENGFRCGHFSGHTLYPHMRFGLLRTLANAAGHSEHRADRCSGFRSAEKGLFSTFFKGKGL